MSRVYFDPYVSNVTIGAEKRNLFVAVNGSTVYQGKAGDFGVKVFFAAERAVREGWGWWTSSTSSNGKRRPRNVRKSKKLGVQRASTRR